MKQVHLLRPCNCALCSGDSGNPLGKKCPYCKAHAPSQESYCQAVDCERVGAEIELDLLNKIGSVYPGSEKDFPSDNG